MTYNTNITYSITLQHTMITIQLQMTMKIYIQVTIIDFQRLLYRLLETMRVYKR